MSGSSNPYSFGSFLGFVSNNFVVLILVTLFFAGGFMAGSMWTENKMLKGGTGAAAPTAAAAPTGAVAEPTADQLAQVPAVTDQDHIRGNKDAKVVLIEYSDYECPFCASFHPTMEQVMADYGDQIAWVYRHFPLSFHPLAQPAAETSECVAELGGSEAFWLFTDAVYASSKANGGITQADLDAALQTAGLSAEAVSSCVDSGKYTQLVADMMDAGATAGISGTPGTIVMTQDGDYELISGALPIAQVKATIDKYLK